MSDSTNLSASHRASESSRAAAAAQSSASLLIPHERKSLTWMDLLGLVFLVGLAVLPPVREIHKQLILLAIGVLQLSEGWFLAQAPVRGRSYVVFIKILLAALLLNHTGGVSIDSSYYPIFYLPVVTAAVYFGPVGTLLWTAVASAAYCSLLIPALQEYELTASGVTELAIRNLFFFLAAIVVNRFAMENRLQTQRYRQVAEELAESNRRLEQAEAAARRSERLAALGQLSAGLAHEIRNPLGIIRGSAEMLNRQLESAQPLSAELAGYIVGEVNKLNTFVSRFLDFARPLQLEIQPHSLASIVNHAIKDVAANWTGPAVKVLRHDDEHLPDVAVDEDLCQRVFANLVQNAYEAMSEVGGGTLRVSLSAVERGEVRGVEARIEDTGPGVPAALREQIFNPMMTTKKTGVGLGLAIVSKIVDDHRGSIELCHTASGACFVVFLPAATQAAASVSGAA